MRWILLLFIIVPTTELALLIYSGQTLGLFPTIAIILLTGIGGAYFAKRQGMKAWNDLKNRMTTMETPGNALIDSVCIFFGGILLLMPGFITDIVGFLLLFKGPRNLIRPFIQKWIYRKMKNGQIVMR
ncbi:FxsA family protein [Filibacter tadaridae]|uniref:Phage T7 F exclusion suppressor FxsA n=1 Tax=Filibacter tadaridae TaxID=2483811 RepID=A0A3P5WYV7_9BACL|nr:FxsA family protein [Filibacter tadaridae]VDC26744.1 phage T7 F exclusion suppressor FxsA [Filibacter tadaridae]